MLQNSCIIEYILLLSFAISLQHQHQLVIQLMKLASEQVGICNQS